MRRILSDIDIEKYGRANWTVRWVQREASGLELWKMVMIPIAES